MSNIIVFIAVIFMLICLLNASVGFDLRKRRNWSFILCGFIGGVLLGLSKNDLKSGIGIGFLVAILASVAAPYMLYLRNRYRKGPPPLP